MGRLEDKTSETSFGDYEDRASRPNKSYRQRRHRLYVRLDAALLVALTPDTSPSGNHEGCDQPSTPDTPVERRRKVAECSRLWQRTKKERLLVQHTYTPGETSRRFYARVTTKFQDNTIVSLGGKSVIRAESVPGLG